ncbi:MAG: hypothetical protein Q6L68_04545 [Thermostichus sp. DG02_5_bins_236]
MPLSASGGADVRVRWIYEEGEAGGEQLLQEFSLAIRREAPRCTGTVSVGMRAA